MRVERSILTVSRSVRDETARRQPDTPMPERIRRVPLGPKNTRSQEEIDEIKDELVTRGAEILSSAGGNGLNNAKNLENIHNGPLVLRTWIGTGRDGKPDDAGKLILADIAQSEKIVPNVVLYEGPTPSGLVIPDGDDRMLFSVHPKGLPSEFVSAIPDDPKYAIINSLGGKDWAYSLTEGIQALTDRAIPYAYIPGSLQLNMIEQRKPEKSVVYKAIRHADVLNVNIDELRTLIEGAGFDPSNDARDFLDQGLALGPKHIFATAGARGSFAASAEGTKVKISTTKPDKIAGLVGAGDSFAAGAVHRLFEDGSVIEAGKWGSAMSSYNVEHVGAHDFTPSREDVEHRLNDPDRRPTVVDLMSRFRSNRTVIDLFVA